MPRYFFHISGSDGLVEDPEGVELRDENEALAEAISAAREIVADNIRKGEKITGTNLTSSTRMELSCSRFRSVTSCVSTNEMQCLARTDCEG